MLDLALTDLPPRQARRETFRDGRVRVLSRSGLHATETALLAHLPPRVAGEILITGNRTGVLGLVLASENPGATMTQHVLDLHHRHPLQRAFAAHRGDAIRCVCAPFLPECSRTALAILQATCHDTPAELLLDLLEDLRASLPAGAVCLAAYDGKPDWLRKQMQQIFGHVKATPAGADVTVFRAQLPAAASPRPAETPPHPAPAPFARRNFSATFTASLPGEPPLRLTTLPGVFAHRRADEGGLALAEVAARDLQPGAHVLDLGCGCGLVGLLLARHATPSTLLCADSHARAIHCTELNALANGIPNVRTLLTDGAPPADSFTLFAGNPPYYSDHKIAEHFIQSAHLALAPGGLAFVVAKNHRWHEACMLNIFGNAEVITRRGYGVVRSARSNRR